MADPALNTAGNWLICTRRQGRGVKPLPGLSDDNTPIAVSVDHIVAVSGVPGQSGVSILLQTGNWVPVQGDPTTVAQVLGFAWATPLVTPTKSTDEKWLLCTPRQAKPGDVGASAPPGSSSDTVVAVSIAQVVVVTDFICYSDAGARCRTNVNLLLPNGNWLTVRGTRNQFAQLLNI